jgi:hypothetical protein
VETHTSYTKHSVDEQRGAEAAVPGSHILQEIVLVEKGKPVVLKEEIVVEKFPHQAVIISDGGPARRLH